MKQMSHQIGPKTNEIRSPSFSLFTIYMSHIKYKLCNVTQTGQNEIITSVNRANEMKENGTKRMVAYEFRAVARVTAICKKRNECFVRSFFRIQGGLHAIAMRNSSARKKIQ